MKLRSVLSLNAVRAPNPNVHAAFLFKCAFVHQMTHGKQAGCGNERWALLRVLKDMLCNAANSEEHCESMLLVCLFSDVHSLDNLSETLTKCVYLQGESAKISSRFLVSSRYVVCFEHLRSLSSYHKPLTRAWPFDSSCSFPS